MRGLVPILALVGCSAAVPKTVPSGAVTQLELVFTTHAVRRLLIFVVDDSPTTEAASLRASVSALLRPTFELTEGDTGYPPSNGDPAARPPADLRVVVVHPSAVGAARAIGPSDDPGLALVSGQSSMADVDALADAVGREMNAFVAGVDAEYSLAQAASSTLDLVVGARPPADAREAALVTSLGSPERFSLIVATSRDDGWNGPVAHFSAAARHRFSTVVLSPLVADTTCQGGALDPSTRLATWVAFMDRASVEVVDTACASWQSQLARPNLDDPYIIADESADLCMPSPVVRLPGDEADCVVDVIMPDDGPCASHPGMLDPPVGVRRPPRQFADAAGPERVCEVS